MTKVIRTLLVESDRSQIDQIKFNINQKFQAGVQVVNNYDELFTRITAEQPQLMILGRIDPFNSFQICEHCHKIDRNLQIVIISRQKIIDGFFRRLAHGWGAIDVITNNQSELNKLFHGLDRSSIPQRTNQPHTSIELSQETLVQLEREIGKKANRALSHPLTGEILVQTGKLVIRSAVEKMYRQNS